VDKCIEKVEYGELRADNCIEKFNCGGYGWISTLKWLSVVD